MNLLVYKATLTPLAIGLATAAGRRFGPAVGGWVAGIPFTSAPVAIFVTLDHGVLFGTITAAGILAGAASQAAFALAYSLAAQRLRWPLALAAAVAAFAAATAGLQMLQPAPVPALEIAIGAVALALSLMPRPSRADAAPAPDVPEPSLPARVDIVARAVVATAFVVVLTALAAGLGPALTGLISPFPIFGAVLIVFPHRLQGGAAALDACRGFLWGLFAFVAFGFSLAQLLPGVGLAAAMVVALAAGLVVQAATLLLIRRGSAPAVASPVTRG